MPRPRFGLVVVVFCCWLLGLIAINRQAIGQPPGTMPPGAMPAAAMPLADDAPAVRPADDSAAQPGAAAAAPGKPGAGTKAAGGESADELNIKAFLLLDEAGNRVIYPGMSFEKLDELQRLQQGWQQPAQLYTIESVDVRGRVIETTAELAITIRIELEPTLGKWVTIPLRMANFHRQGPADVTGVERYRLDFSPDGSGHLLHLMSDTRRSVVVAMRAKARVSPAPSSAVEFRLPEAPSEVFIEVPSPTASATVIGRGDEVLETKSQQNATDVRLTSGGGTFSLRFGTQLPVVDTRPVLESESRIVVDWQQADNAPIVTQELAVRSVRGDLPRFDLALPAGVPLLQQPTVRGGAPFEIEEGLAGDVTTSPAGLELRDGSPGEAGLRGTVGIVPIGQRGDSRVELGVVTQMRSADGRAGGTVVIRPVSVVDAMEQTGEIEIRTPRDYRLRWTPQPWVSSQWDQADADTGAIRTYRFRFDRVPFELPIWLSARAKRLRVEGDYRLTFYDSAAALKVLLRTSGGVPDSRILAIQVAGWRVQSTLIGGSTVPVQVDQTGDLLEIDLSSLPSGGESDRIEISLVRSLADTSDRVELALPQIVSEPELVDTIASTLSVVTQADYRFIADLGNSIGLGDVLRVYGPAGPPADPPITTGSSGTVPGAAVPGGGSRGVDPIVENRYSLPDISQRTQLAGFLVTERPRITYQAEVDLAIVGNQLVEEVNWVIYPQGGLRGRLPVVWSRGETEGQTGGDGAGGQGATPVYALAPGAKWSVTVDDMPAILQASDENEYSIYSDFLAGGPHRVRLRRTRDLPPAMFSESTVNAAGRIAGIELPRPGVADVTLRGQMTIRLRGDRGLELVWRDTAALGPHQPGEPILVASQPVADLPVSVRRVDRKDEETLVRRAVLRTAISRDTQHDYLIASVQGGGLLRLPLVGARPDVLVRATIDGVATEVLRLDDVTGAIRLGENETHTVSVQLWSPRESSLIAEKVRPILTLPTGTERFYWEIVTPQDDHLVWASPSTGRAMRWQFDRWRLYRQPVQTGVELASWAGASWDTRLPPGNRYLFVGVDASGLRTVMMSRLAIWMVVGTSVLLVSCLLTYFPRSRHPLLAVVGAVLLTGMTLLLPDASVLAGQVMLVAMLMVAVMAGVGYLLAPKRTPRVLTPATERVIDRSDRSSARGGSPSRGNAAASGPASPPSGTSARGLPANLVTPADSRLRGSAAEASP